MMNTALDQRNAAAAAAMDHQGENEFVAPFLAYPQLFPYHASPGGMDPCPASSGTSSFRSTSLASSLMIRSNADTSLALRMEVDHIAARARAKGKHTLDFGVPETPPIRTIYAADDAPKLSALGNSKPTSREVGRVSPMIHSSTKKQRTKKKFQSDGPAIFASLKKGLDDNDPLAVKEALKRLPEIDPAPLGMRGEVDLILDSIRNFPSEAQVVGEACQALAHLSWSRQDLVKEVVKAGGIPFILKSMRELAEKQNVLVHAITAITKLAFPIEYGPKTLRFTPGAEQSFTLGGLAPVTDAMKRHGNAPFLSYVAADMFSYFFKCVPQIKESRERMQLVMAAVGGGDSESCFDGTPSEGAAWDCLLRLLHNDTAMKDLAVELGCIAIVVNILKRTRKSLKEPKKSARGHRYSASRVMESLSCNHNVGNEFDDKRWAARVQAIYDADGIDAILNCMEEHRPLPSNKPQPLHAIAALRNLIGLMTEDDKTRVIDAVSTIIQEHRFDRTVHQSASALLEALGVEATTLSTGSDGASPAAAACFYPPLPHIGPIDTNLKEQHSIASALFETSAEAEATLSTGNHCADPGSEADDAWGYHRLSHTSPTDDAVPKEENAITDADAVSILRGLRSERTSIDKPLPSPPRTHHGSFGPCYEPPPWYWYPPSVQAPPRTNVGSFGPSHERPPWHRYR